jgi:hypothetical protein
VVNQVAFNGDAIRELASQFLALAQKQATTVPLMVGHRIVGTPLFFTETQQEAENISTGR